MSGAADNHPSVNVQSSPNMESPWKKAKPANAEELAKQAKIMAAPNVVHSNYVPSQLERHLEFMHFNSGKIPTIVINYGK